MDKLPSKTVRQPKSGVNVTQLKRSFTQLDQRGLYRSIFRYLSLIVFGTLLWIYFTSNFNDLPKVYNASASDAPLYLSHRYFRVFFWVSLIVLVVVQLSAFLQRKLKWVNDASMIVLYLGYMMAAGFMFISSPLYSFLSQYFNNQDPFRAFSKPAQVLGNLNYELYGLFLISAIALMGFSYLMRILRKLKFRIAVIKHN